MNGAAAEQEGQPRSHPSASFLCVDSVVPFFPFPAPFLPFGYLTPAAAANLAALPPRRPRASAGRVKLSSTSVNDAPACLC